jgi:hypothetical protein
MDLRHAKVREELAEYLRVHNGDADPADLIEAFLSRIDEPSAVTMTVQSLTRSVNDDRVEEEVQSVVAVIPRFCERRELKTLRQQYDFVTHILSCFADQLQFDFDYKSAVRNILQGRFIIGVGPTQSGKSQLLVVVALCSIVQGRPTILLGCDVMANVQELGRKLQENMFSVINSHQWMLSSQLSIEVLCLANNPKMNNLTYLRNNIAKIANGRMPVLLSHTTNQIWRTQDILDEIEVRTPNGVVKTPNIVMDEADKFWSSPIEEEYDNMTKREYAFYELVKKENGYSGIHSLFQVTATPPDCIWWQIKNNIPLWCIALDKEVCRVQRGYIGVEKCKPLQIDGQDVFLEEGSITRKTSYGREDTYVTEMYNQVETLRRQNRLGLFLIDVTNPLVNVEDNTTDRALAFESQYPEWIFLVIHGKGVNRVTNGRTDPVVVFKAKKRDRYEDEDDEMYDSLRHLLGSYDSDLKKPVCLIGYTMIRRSLSSRSDLRVPTHIIVAPSKATTLADLIQMLGRCMGKNAPILTMHNYDSVITLMFDKDWQAAKKYDDFVREVLKRCATGRVEDLTEMATEKFPSEYRKVLGTGRKFGNKRLGTTQMMTEEIQFEESEESDESMRRIAMCGVLNHNQVRMLRQINRNGGRDKCSNLGDEKSHRVQLRQLVLKGYLSNVVRTGIYTITDLGRRYLEDIDA